MLLKSDNVDLNIFIMIIHKNNEDIKFIKKNSIVKSDDSESVKEENTEKALKIK
jgi:hypothetical protein